MLNVSKIGLVTYTLIFSVPVSPGSGRRVVNILRTPSLSHPRLLPLGVRTERPCGLRSFLHGRKRRP